MPIARIANAAPTGEGIRGYERGNNGALESDSASSDAAEFRGISRNRPNQAGVARSATARAAAVRAL